MQETVAYVCVALLFGALLLIIVHKLETALRARIAVGTDWASREASFPSSPRLDDEFPSHDRNREWDIYWRPGGLFNQQRDDD
jgi:hypothetical protein